MTIWRNFEEVCMIWPVDMWVHGKVTSGPNRICKSVPAGTEMYQGHYRTFQGITVRALWDKMTMIPNAWPSSMRLKRRPRSTKSLRNFERSNKIES